MFGSQSVEFGDAVLRIVVLEPEFGAAEGVGEDEVGTCVEVIAGHTSDGFGGIGVHQLGATAGFEAVLLEISPGGAVEDQDLVFEALQYLVSG